MAGGVRLFSTFREELEKLFLGHEEEFPNRLSHSYNKDDSTIPGDDFSYKKKGNLSKNSDTTTAQSSFKLINNDSDRYWIGNILMTFLLNQIIHLDYILRLLVSWMILIYSPFDSPVKDTTIEDPPTRLEHSYFNDRVYWNLSLVDVDNVDYTHNTTIHPRIAWKVTNTTTTIFPEIDDVLTPEREWVWPSSATTPLGTFPFEPLTHRYNTNTGGVGKKISCKP